MHQYTVYADVYIYVYGYVNVQYQRKQAEYYKRIPKQIDKANENPLRGTNAQTNAQTHNAQKFESGNRADAMTKTYQIHCGKTPARNGSPLAKNDE